MSLPSRTSVWAAAARAIGAREPDPNVRNPDWLAEKLIGAHELEALGEHALGPALSMPYAEAIQKLEVVGSARILIARTRFIDERLEAAVRDGIGQLVIMGAGFDSRAYRLAAMLKDVSVFEVDRPDTQQAKIRRVKEAVGETPSNVTYVPVDFREMKFGDALLDAGYQQNVMTFFIWEGVTMYLPEGAVRETLQWIASHAPSGSSIVFDYVYAAIVRILQDIDPANLPEEARQRYGRFKQLTANEPWHFGVPDKAEAEFLREVGLEVRTVLGMNGSETVARYLTRADGSIYGTLPATEQQWYLLLEAAVPSSQP